MEKVSGRAVRPVKFALVMLVSALLWSWGGSTLAQDESSGDERRVAEVTRAVEVLTALEMGGDVHQLYDRLHPDVRDLLSRSGLATFYESPDAVIPHAPVEVVSVAFGEWTWPVTGEAYDDTATVTVRVQGERAGTAVDETLTLHLVEDGGNWRWFFGESEQDVDAQDVLASERASYESDFDNDGYADIDRYWADAFADAALDYHAPDEIIPLRGTAETGCGVEENLDEIAIFYCTLDETIYYNPDFRDEVEENVGVYAWYHIVSHEWGHHIQNILGIDASADPELDGGLYAIELELQADCLAGTYTQDAFAREAIGDTELDEAIDITAVAGDMSGTTWDDPAAHGSGSQRRQSLVTGYDDGFLGCNLDLLSAAG